VLALQAGALILGLAAIGLIILLERDEPQGSVTPGWRRRHEEGKGQL
jgi:hypothetical protein